MPVRPFSALLHQHRTEMLIGLALVLATLVVFGQVISFPFINLDDNDYVYDNPVVAAGLTWNGLKWALTTFYSSGYWHPLTWLSHMADCQFFGMNAGWHHLTNLLLHSANAVLLFLGLRRMTGAVWRSATVAALFALHPLHVESVVWVAERKDVLSAFFWMLTMLAYSFYVEQPASWKRYGLVALPLALGLMSKPMIVTLPFVLLLLDYWPLVRRRPATTEDAVSWKPALWPLVREKIPLLVLSAAIISVTIFAPLVSGSFSRGAPGLIVFQRLSFPERAAHSLTAYLEYLGKTIWPGKLAIFYALPTSVPLWQPVAAGGILLAITLAVVWGAKLRPYLAVGWLWYLGVLVPVIGVLGVATPMADRYTYLPHVGLFILVVWAGWDVVANRARAEQMAKIVAVVILMALSVVSWMYLRVWHDNQTLYEHALAVTPENYLPYCVLGQILANEGNLAQAESYYRKSLSLQPNCLAARNGLGILLTQEGRHEEAAAQFVEALQRGPASPEIHFNYANLLVTQGKFAEAVPYYAEVVRLKPNDAEGYVNLGMALARQKRFDEAVARLQQAIRLDPNSALAYRYLGNSLFEAGKPAEAVDAYSHAVQLEPNSVELHYNLGLALARNGKRNDAMTQLSAALKLNPNFQAARDALDALENDAPDK